MSKTKSQKPKTNSDIVAILLAAGQSRRMGAFKPLLPFGPTTVIRSCLNNLNAAGVADIIVVTGHRAADIQASLRDLPLVQVAFNSDPTSEMSASIAAGVALVPAKAKAVLIALGDQPAIPAAVTQTVIEAWRAGAKLVIPQFQDKGGHPVLIDLSFRKHLLTLDPHRGLKGFFDDHRTLVRRLNVNSSYIARDMDTWDDYRALHEEMFGTSPNVMDR